MNIPHTDHQRQLLDIHRRSLAHYLDQVAAYGGITATPPVIIHGIRRTREQIREIKQALQDQGILVEDWPDDSEA